MIQAKFKHTDIVKNQSIYGTVTLKTYGKVSVSLAHANDYGFTIKYQAKKLAQQIVDSDFNHPSVISLTRENVSGLVDVLKKETVGLKAAYIDKTVEYAGKRYDWAIKEFNLTEEERIKKYGMVEIPINKQNSYWAVEADGSRVYKTKTHKISDAASKNKNEARDILGRTLKMHIEKAVAKAESHYESSIERLASRLNKKGINDKTVMELESSAIGANFTTLIHHEGTTTKAWTIIAEGQIQCPHFRYLVK